jgi:hypothetical protein
MADKLTLEEIAANAKCSVRTVARASASGALITVKEHGLVVATPCEAQRWIEARQAGRRRAAPPDDHNMRQILELETRGSAAEAR